MTTMDTSNFVYEYSFHDIVMKMETVYYRLTLEW